MLGQLIGQTFAFFFEILRTEAARGNAKIVFRFCFRQSVCDFMDLSPIYTIYMGIGAAISG